MVHFIILIFISVFIFSLANLVRKSGVLEITWNSLLGYILIYQLKLALIFQFSFFIQFFRGEFCPEIGNSLNELNFVQGYIVYADCYYSIYFFNFSFHPKKFGKFRLKSLMFSKFIRVSYRGSLLYAGYDFGTVFLDFFHSIFWR